jgi:hypothetical protein
LSGGTPGPLDRPNPSTILREVREARLRESPKDPSARMEAAFLLSIEARKLRRAALTESGAAEDEVIDSLRARNR